MALTITKTLLKNRTDIHTFHKGYTAHLTRQIDITCLMKSRCCGLYYKGDMIGGYAINESRNLGALDVLPEDIYLQLTRRLDISDLCELAALWFLPAYYSVQARAFFWHHIGTDISQSKKSHVVTFYRGNDKLVSAWAERFSMQTLYRGLAGGRDAAPVTVLAGQTADFQSARNPYLSSRRS